MIHAKFRRIVQKPGDIGQPGYWSDGVKPASAAAKPPAP